MDIMKETKTGINKIEAIKKVEQKFIAEVRSKYEEYQNDDEVNKLYKDEMRKKFVKNVDERPVQDILKESFMENEEEII